MPATGLKIVGTGACLPWCSISSSFQNSLKKSGCNKVNDQEEGGGIRQTFLHFINKINKHKIKAAAPHGRLPHTKYKLKSRPGPLLSFTVVTLPFTLPKLLLWDSRPVRGAGVIHYHLLHWPCSVPMALGPAPLVTYPHRPLAGRGYNRDCALLTPPGNFTLMNDVFKVFHISF